MTCLKVKDFFIKALHNIFRKFWPPERIVSDNGPCFKSETFKHFCELMEIKHTTSSPYYHQSNGRAERAIQTMKQMLKKCSNEIEFTFATIAYHDTPITDSLPSPSELMFNRRTITRLNPIPQQSTLTDIQKVKLNEKRAAHLKPSKYHDREFVPNQPIWFTEDGSEEWKSGYIESKDVHPHAYWIVNTETNRRTRRNKKDLKMRYPVSRERCPEHQVDTPVSDQMIHNTPNETTDNTPEVTQSFHNDSTTKSLAEHSSLSKMPSPKPVTEMEPTSNISSYLPVTNPTQDPNTKSPISVTRSGRSVKSNKKPDFQYN